MIDSYWESVLIFLGINTVLALSLYLPMSAGQLSLGHGGFMAIGAYVTVVATTWLGWPLVAGLAAGGGAAALAGAAVGFPALRIKGVYLIILTLGFGEIIRIFFLNFEPTGGASGLGGVKHLTTLPLVWAVAALMLICLARFRGARIGRALRAVHEDELAAEAMGVNLTRVKVAAFALGAFGGGIGGGLYAHHALFIDPAQFGFFRSAEIFLFVVLGGLGTYWGPVVGAAVVTLLPELLRFVQEWRMTVFGSLLILCAILRPAGILSRRRAAG
ncbi:MAG: branched-chain amino acid ABC transporter permease [Candidatus Rokuibacteriota bacterium]